MSCNITVSVSDDFAKEAKRLAKKYPSFKQDYKEFLESIKNNPLQGDEITKNIRKIRMAIKAKGKGKSGGARVITFNVLTDVENGHVVFLLLYDKEDASTSKSMLSSNLCETWDLILNRIYNEAVGIIQIPAASCLYMGKPYREYPHTLYFFILFKNIKVHSLIAILLQISSFCPLGRYMHPVYSS